jgi:glycosyltransferase involved in cell wall biosynthesis
MKLVALVEARDHVCCRYRLAAFAPILARAGYELELVEYPKTTWGFLKLSTKLRNADAVILQRRLVSAWEWARLRKHCKKLIFDFDDAVWLRDSYSPKGFESAKRSGRFQQTVAGADLIIAGNAYLADHAKRFTSAPVCVIPTCVNLALYPRVQHSSETKSIRLVWIGSGSTLRGLDRFRDVLEAIGQSVPGVRLRLICDNFLQLENLAIEPCPWDASTEGERIAECDVGISWIPDDHWSRGKCGLKILQYQAAGLPVITNPVGVHPEMVSHHKNGLLATEPEEWINAVRHLAAYPITRKTYGDAAHEQVREKYSVQAGALLWISELQRLLKPHLTGARDV